jgi:hypothetical protein
MLYTYNNDGLFLYSVNAVLFEISMEGLHIYGINCSYYLHFKCILIMTLSFKPQHNGTTKYIQKYSNATCADECRLHEILKP